MISVTPENFVSRDSGFELPIGAPLLDKETNHVRAIAKAKQLAQLFVATEVASPA